VDRNVSPVRSKATPDITLGLLRMFSSNADEKLKVASDPVSAVNLDCSLTKWVCNDFSGGR
jgi:hypothetical protein